MQQSQKIEVTHPTMRRTGLFRAGLHHTGLHRRMTLTNGLTVGAALVAIVLSVTLSSAANTDTCARPFDMGPIDTAISAPCDYR